MTPITEQGLLDIGFESCRRDGVLYNGHVYDFQVSGNDFYVCRDKVRNDDKFFIKFHNFYGENIYHGFEYIEQISLLIKALHP